MTSFASRFFAKAVGAISAYYYLVWSRSWQYDNEEIARLDQLLQSGESIILVVWHGRFFPMFSLLQGKNISVLTSESPRGEIISQICRRFGFNPSILPSAGQGAKYRHMERVLKSAQISAFAIDGPLGPNHVAKPGAIKVASNFGHLIVPISFASHKKRVATKRWDNRETPHWGSHISLAVGDPIRVPCGLNATELKDWCDTVALAINAVDQRAEDRVQVTKER